MANERSNLIVVIIQITNERGFFSCLIRVEFINRSKNGPLQVLCTSIRSLLFLRADSFFPPYSFYFLYRYIYMYIYVLFFWPLRLRKSSTRDVLNRFSVNVVRFDGPLVIYDLRGCGLVLRAHREVFEIFLDGVSRRKAGVELADSSNCRGTLVKFWLRGYTLCIDIAPCEKYNNLFRNMRMALVSSSSYISFYSRYDSTYCFLSASRYTSYDFWWNVQFQFFLPETTFKIHLQVLYCANLSETTQAATSITLKRFQP